LPHTVSDRPSAADRHNHQRFFASGQVTAVITAATSSSTRLRIDKNGVNLQFQILDLATLLVAAADPAQLFLGQLDFAVVGRGGEVVAS
jgi:hypothetical protein